MRRIPDCRKDNEGYEKKKQAAGPPEEKEQQP